MAVSGRSGPRCLLVSVVIATGIMALSGCGGIVSRRPGRPPPPSGRPSVVADHCPIPLPTVSQRRGGIPAGFRPARVLLCREDFRTFPGEGRWDVEIERQATRGIGSLLVALRRPVVDPSPTDGTPVACAAIAVGVPWFALVDAHGRAVLPEVPRDPLCGQPSSVALAALRALPYQTVWVRRIRQVESQREVRGDAAGCPAWKDMISIEESLAGARPRTAAGPVFSSVPAMLTICRYLRGGTGTNAIGSFRGIRQLSGARLTTLLSRLAQVPVAGTCGRTETAFAVLHPSSPAGEPAYVELDGCHRVLRPDNTLGQLDPTAVHALAAAISD